MSLCPVSNASPRSPSRLEADSIAESYGEVLLRGGCALGRADSAGSDRGTLRCRGWRLLWHPSCEMAALLGRAHLALCRSASSGSRHRGWRPACTSRRPSAGYEPKGQTARRQHPVRRADRCGRWFARGRVVGDSSKSSATYGSGSARKVTNTSTSAASGKSLLFGGFVFWLWLMWRGQ